MVRPSRLIAAGALIAASAVFFPGIEPRRADIPQAELDLLLNPALLAQTQCGRDGQRRSAFFKPTLQIALASAARASTAPAQEDVPLWPGLGERSFPVTTASTEAQAYFDQGFALLYGFNHWEAIRSFRKAQSLDPNCALCYWGEAKAHGPNINAPMADEAQSPASLAIARAQELGANASRKERMLIEALARRYAPEGERAALDLDYANALEATHKLFPDDQDIAALYAEALMDLSPWDYWERDRRTPKPHIAKAIDAVERVIAANPDHAGAIHLLIHLMEASDMPERAEPGADRLAALMPGAGHLVHMPGHIYFRIGRYLDSLETNVRAVEVDEDYLSRTEGSPLYRYGYYPHNVHFVLVSAQMAGDGKTALEYARKLDALIPFEAVSTAALVQPVKVAPYYAYLEFGDADDIAELPEPPESLPFVKGVWHYMHGVAAVRSGEADRAAASADAIAALRTSPGVEELATQNMPAPAILQLAELVLRARIDAQGGDYAAAKLKLEEAVGIQNALPYTEPPYWYYPVEQTLGAVLLASGDADGAVKQFRAALVRHPNNAWSLYGLLQAQRAAGESTAGYTAELLQKAAHDPKAITLDRL